MLNRRNVIGGLLASGLIIPDANGQLMLTGAGKGPNGLPPLNAFTFIGAGAQLSGNLASRPTSTVQVTSWSQEIEDTNTIFAPTSSKLIIPSALNGRLCIVASFIRVDGNAGSPGSQYAFNITRTGSGTFDGAALINYYTTFSNFGFYFLQTQPIIVTTAEEYEVTTISTFTNTDINSGGSYFGIFVIG